MCISLERIHPFVSPHLCERAFSTYHVVEADEENDKERRKRHQIMIRINGISSTVFLSLSPLRGHFLF